ncbi:MAG: hypothetical protein A2176_08595 [Spirochaetes bacterium RBG_13_51_14]|nr:MAG: hypothetical protein A2176_08595 [Spirochaetes bacterium RBG_13_51_14]
MFIETTFNIHTVYLRKINNAARTFRMSRTEIIIILLKKMMHDAQNPQVFGKRVRYQNRIASENWHTFHARLRPDDYEYFLDLRKFLKMSVSCILANAVEKHLSKLKRINNTDNYLYRNYVLVKEMIDNIVCWKLLWGYPTNIRKAFSLP